MRTKIFIFVILLTITVFSACSNSNNSTDNERYSSEDEAIEKGLSERDNLLSTESYRDVTLVFFERDGALGISILTEKNGEFGLVWNEPLYGFDSNGDYITGGFEMKINDENMINILAGKVFDSTVNQIILEDNKTKDQIEIWSREFYKSKLFYFVLGDDEYTDKTVLALVDQQEEKWKKILYLEQQS